MNVSELAKQFRKLIDERDSIPFHKQETNARCVEIDDVLIPAIIKQIPSREMELFNELINDGANVIVDEDLKKAIVDIFD
jgi:hypothetical protein